MSAPVIGYAVLRCHDEPHGPQSTCTLCGCWASGNVFEANGRDEWCENSSCPCHDDTQPAENVGCVLCGETWIKADHSETCSARTTLVVGTLAVRL